MPYLGLLPFLQMKVITLNVMKHCVNALSRASPISTIHADFHWGGILVCQCPISGFSHFYDYISSELQRSQNCVNALSRASPISTNENTFGKLLNFLCQCPISGFSHFYSYYQTFPFYEDVCQCPISGFSHFYLFFILPNICLVNCVNALSRASPISTDY